MTFEALDDAIAGAEPEDLQALYLGLAARLATIAGRMAGAPPRRWVAVERAAEGAGVDPEDLRRWARRPGVAWASWPTKRTLLSDLDAFNRWLSAGKFKRGRQRNEEARGRTKPPGTPTGEATTAHEDARTAAGSR